MQSEITEHWGLLYENFLSNDELNEQEVWIRLAFVGFIAPIVVNII